LLLIVSIGMPLAYSWRLWRLDDATRRAGHFRRPYAGAQPFVPKQGMRKCLTDEAAPA
jgi:hypothetical protein